ncbi:MAG: hypothetical protein ACI9GH_000103 [Candidatus Paceibacteria bacterium]|jgi:hypothetical protein
MKKPKYFDGKVSEGFVALYSARSIMFVASGLLGLFLPVFIYQILGNSFEGMILFYGLASLLYILFLAFGVRLADKIGFSKSLKLSPYLLVIFFGIFYFMTENNVAILLPISLIVLSTWRIMYWTPYKTNLAKFTNQKNRGRQISAFYLTQTILSVLLPIIAGFMINEYGYGVLFLIAIILHLVSSLPYRWLPKVPEKYSWGYKETWHKFFKLMKNKTVISYVAIGAESFIGLYVWPIFLFLLLKGDFLKVGLVSTSVVFIAVILQLVSGKIIDKKMSRNKLLKWGTILYSVGWVFKIFIATTFQVFIVGAYHSVAQIFTRTPFDALTYDMSSKEGTYIDEFTVIMEMAISLGRVIAAVMVITLSMFFSIEWLFVIAAVSTLLFNYVGGEKMYLKKTY